MSNGYKVQCDRGAVELEMTGAPRVHAFCHCEDCRTLLDVPYHSVAAWGADRSWTAATSTAIFSLPRTTLTSRTSMYMLCGS